MKALIFLVGKDRRSCQNLKRWLEDADYSVREYASADILPEIEAHRPAAVLVDARSEKDVFELCSLIKGSPSHGRTSVVLLVEPTSLADYPDDLTLQVDDCLFLPVNADQLLARIEATLRQKPASPLEPETFIESVLRSGGVELNLLALRLSVSGATIPTTLLEFRLLEYLVRNPDRVFTRDQLLDAVWGQERFVTPRSVDACVRRIRNKIEARGRQGSFLKTVRGVGYCLEAPFRGFPSRRTASQNQYSAASPDFPARTLPSGAVSNITRAE